MSTDTPNAWGKNPPFDNPIEDIWDNAVGDTVETMKKDLLGIIHCAVEEEVEFYMPCDDYIMDNADDFKEEVTQALIKDFSLTDKLMAETRKMLGLIREKETIIEGQINTAIDQLGQALHNSDLHYNGIIEKDRIQHAMQTLMSISQTYINLKKKKNA